MVVQSDRAVQAQIHSPDEIKVANKVALIAGIVAGALAAIAILFLSLPGATLLVAASLAVGAFVVVGLIAGLWARAVALKNDTHQVPENPVIQDFERLRNKSIEDSRKLVEASKNRWQKTVTDQVEEQISKFENEDQKLNEAEVELERGQSELLSNPDNDEIKKNVGVAKAKIKSAELMKEWYIKQAKVYIELCLSQGLREDDLEIILQKFSRHRHLF